MIERAITPDARATLVAYLASKIGGTPQALVGQMPFEAVAVKRGDRVMGAVLYLNYRQVSIEMACAGEPGWMTRANIRDLFAYPFHQLGVYTVLTTVLRRNKVARAFNEKLGFKELCVIPSGNREEDTFLFGMSRPQCLWLGAEQQKLAA